MPVAWISVKDRLPEDGVRVIVWASGALATGATVDNCVRGTWIYSPLMGLAVTHWRPLPDPPKEGE